MYGFEILADIMVSFLERNKKLLISACCKIYHCKGVNQGS